MIFEFIYEKNLIKLSILNFKIFTSHVLFILFSLIKEVLFNNIPDGLKQISCFSKNLVKFETSLKSLNTVIITVRVTFIIEQSV